MHNFMEVCVSVGYSFFGVVHSRNMFTSMNEKSQHNKPEEIVLIDLLIRGPVFQMKDITNDG